MRMHSNTQRSRTLLRYTALAKSTTALPDCAAAAILCWDHIAARSAETGTTIYSKLPCQRPPD